MSKKLHIEILGRQYDLKGQSDQDYVEKLASFVDGKMREMSSHSPGSPYSKLAILSAINIAHELFQLQQQQQEMNATVDNATRAMVENIEEEVRASQLK
ncbi:MAG: cell division protein ZapA [Nitrospiria bacterium]